MQKQPHIAFAFRAIALALKAKGCRATVQDALDLIDFCALTVPGDPAALRACTGFAQTLRQGQPIAGQALFNFITEWRRGEMSEAAARTQEALHDMAPEHFQWQDRKDCGHD